MKAGLFECDHTNEAIREQFGDYADMFVRLFPELEWTFYDVVNGEFPSDLNACDVYFATGSRRSVYDAEDWINRVKQTIRQLATMDKYFVGFCFGHQLLGEAMGGNVQKSPNG
ncbi:MAG: amidotransferase, partial [Bacteroidota bacterium]